MGHFPVSLPEELDTYGIITYSLLTFMATVSMLVFLEECAYIYKKVPVNKKSPIIWVNGAAPVSVTRREQEKKMNKKKPSGLC